MNRVSFQSECRRTSAANEIMELTSTVDEVSAVLLGRLLGDFGPAAAMLLRVLGRELREEVLVRPLPSISMSSTSTSALDGDLSN
jgi:hypothetical protein